jgi:hypothetical protein
MYTPYPLSQVTTMRGQVAELRRFHARAHATLARWNAQGEREMNPYITAWTAMVRLVDEGVPDLNKVGLPQRCPCTGGTGMTGVSGCEVCGGRGWHAVGV